MLLSGMRQLARWFRARWRFLARTALSLGALGMILWLIAHSWAALLPFQIGIVLAYLFLPLVNRMEGSMPRWAAVATVLLMAVACFVAAVGFVLPPLIDQTTTALETFPNIEELGAQASNLYAAMQDYIAALPAGFQEPIRGTIDSAIRNVQDNITNYLQDVGTFVISSTFGVINTVTFLLGFLVVPFWLFYVMNDHQKGLQTLDRLLPTWLRPDFWAITTIMDRIFSSYVRGQLILGVIVGVAVYAGLSLLEMLGVQGIQFKLLLAVIAGFTELIPFFGPILGAIPAIAIGLFDSWQTALAIVALYSVIQQLENHLLVPRIVGESVGIHPAVLMVLAIALSQLGLIWILLAAPLAAVTRDVFRYVYGRLQDPPLPAGVLPDTLLSTGMHTATTQDPRVPAASAAMPAAHSPAPQVADQSPAQADPPAAAESPAAPADRSRPPADSAASSERS